MNFDIANLAITISNGVKDTNTLITGITGILGAVIGAISTYHLNLRMAKNNEKRSNNKNTNISLCKLLGIYDTLFNIIKDIDRMDKERSLHMQWLNSINIQSEYPPNNPPLFNDIILKFLYKVNYNNPIEQLDFIAVDNPMLYHSIAKIQVFVDTLNTAINSHNSYTQQLSNTLSKQILATELPLIYDNLLEKKFMIEKSNNILIKELYETLTLLQEYGIKNFGLKNTHKFTIDERVLNVIKAMEQVETK